MIQVTCSIFLCWPDMDSSSNEHHWNNTWKRRVQAPELRQGKLTYRPYTYIHTYRPPTGVRSRGNWRKGVKTDSPSGEANTCAERIFTNHTFNAKTRHGEKRAMMALNWPVSGKWSSRQTEQNQRAKERNPSTLYIPIKLPVRLIFAKKSDFILELSLPWNKMAELIWVPWKHYKASEKTKFPNQYLEF